MSRLRERLSLTSPVRSRRLAQAAGISSAVLVCHPETWQWIQELGAELRPPRPVSGTLSAGEGGSLAEVAVSGVALALLMQAMHEVIAAGFVLDRTFPPHDRAIARRIYLAAAEVVRQVTSDPAASAPRIIFDDRSPS